MRRRVATSAVAILALAGCATPQPWEGASSVGAPAETVLRLADLDPIADPLSLTGAATAWVLDSQIDQVPAGAPDLPVTVESRVPAGSQQVTVTDVSRIVAVDISGSIATTLMALGQGENIVGVDSSADLGDVHPTVITSSGHSVTPEAVLALKPTLVITDGTVGPLSAFTQLADAGITVVFVNQPEGFTGAQELARQVGQAVGLPEAGEALGVRIAAEVAAVAQRIEDLLPHDKALRPRIAFLYLRGGAGVYYLFGDEYGADQLIDALGGIDVAQEIGIDGMAPLTDEAMLAANPDVLLVMSEGLESVGGVDGLLALSPAIALTPAGQHRRVIAMDDREILGFGPRSAAVLEALAVALYTPGE